LAQFDDNSGKSRRASPAHEAYQNRRYGRRLEAKPLLRSRTLSNGADCRKNCVAHPAALSMSAKGEGSVMTGVEGSVMTRVGDVLRQKDTRIITIRLRETVAIAVTLMNRENVHALVVKDVCRTEGNVVVGVFSERDVARGLAAHGGAVLNLPVANFLNRPLIGCAANDTVDTVLQLMDEHQVRLLPVLEDHTLIGVISISDVIRHCVQRPVLGTQVDILRAEFAGMISDAARRSG
jgi:CBS domain-containing protein